MRSEDFPLPQEAAGLSETVRRDLLALSEGLDAQLLPVGEALLLLVQTVDAVIEGLTAIGTAIAQGPAERAITDALVASRTLLDAPDRHAMQRGHFAALRERVGTLSSLSDELDRVLLMLEFYCVNMKIAAGGAEDFVNFADEMRSQLSTGRLQLTDVGATVARLFDGFGTMLTVDRDLAEECKRHIPSVPEEIAEAAQRLRRQQAAVAATVAAGEQSARRIRSEVGAALAAIQIADNVRQRIEHAAFICDCINGAAALEEPLRGDVEGHLAALATAQIEVIAKDFCEDAGRLLASLEGLLPETRHLLESVRQDHSILESASLVERFGERIAHSARLTAQLQETDHRARQILAQVLGTIEELSGRVERVRDLGVEVGYMSVNANLRSRGNSGISKVVSVIATEIKVQSTIIDEVSTRFVGLTRQIAEIADAIAEGNRGGPVDIQMLLAGSHKALAEVTARSRDGVVRVGADCSALIGRLPDTIGRVRESLMLAAGLETASALLAPMARRVSPEVLEDAAHPLGALLRKVAGIYTMASERHVHAGFAPADSAPAEEAPLPPATCDDDDVLF